MSNIKSTLKTQYGIDSINICRQQGGWTSLAYKVIDNKCSYFLKVYEKRRTSTPKWTALIDNYVPIIRWLGYNTDL